MEALWERSPQTASEVTKVLRPTMGWAENTVRTLLTRLVEKGALKVKENASGTRAFTPAVKREDCVQAESESFMQRIFRGAAISPPTPNSRPMRSVNSRNCWIRTPPSNRHEHASLALLLDL